MKSKFILLFVFLILIGCSKDELISSISDKKESSNNIIRDSIPTKNSNEENNDDENLYPIGFTVNTENFVNDTTIYIN